MELKHLFQREGEERRRADLAACASSRQAHLGLAKGYRERIAQWRRETAMTAEAEAARD